MNFLRININYEFYDTIRNLHFAPNISVSGLELPAEELTAEICTEDEITEGQTVWLQDRDGVTWAIYWITDITKLDKNWVSMKAVSVVSLLDRYTMSAKCLVYPASLKREIELCFSGVTRALPYENVLEIDFEEDTNIIGYFPRQTARERLQWLCARYGLYVQTATFGDFFSCPMAIVKKLNQDTIQLQPDEVFYKPQVEYGDVIDEISATTYAYTEGTPSSTDEWVSDMYGGQERYFIVTKSIATLRNPNVSAEAMPRQIHIDGIQFMLTANDFLTRLASYYFDGNQKVTAEILSRGTPRINVGDFVSIPINDTERVSGYVQSSEFIFGTSCRQRIVLQQVGAVATGKVIVNVIVTEDGEEEVEGVTVEDETTYDCGDGVVIIEDEQTGEYTIIIDGDEHSLDYFGYDSTMEQESIIGEKQGVEIWYTDSDGNVIKDTEDGIFVEHEGNVYDIDDFDYTEDGDDRIYHIYDTEARVDENGDVVEVWDDSSTIIGEEHDGEIWYTDSDGNIIKVTEDGIVVEHNGNEYDLDDFNYTEDGDDRIYYVFDTEVRVDEDGNVDDVWEWFEHRTYHITDDVRIEDDKVIKVTHEEKEVDSYTIEDPIDTTVDELPVYVCKEGELVAVYAPQFSSFVVTAGEQTKNISYIKVCEYDFAEQIMHIYSVYDDDDELVLWSPTAEIIYKDGATLPKYPRYVDFPMSTSDKMLNTRFANDEIQGEPLTVRQNGQYTADTVYKSVEANVQPKTEAITIDANGFYTPEGDAFSEVAVNVTKAIKGQSVVIRESGSFSPPQEYDCFYQVSVNIEAAEDKRMVLERAKWIQGLVVVNAATIDGINYRLCIRSFDGFEHLKVVLWTLANGQTVLEERSEDVQDFIFNTQIYKREDTICVGITHAKDSTYTYYEVDVRNHTSVKQTTEIDENPRYHRQTAYVYNPQLAMSSARLMRVGCWDVDREELNYILYATGGVSLTTQMPEPFVPAYYNQDVCCQCVQVQDANYSRGRLYVNINGMIYLYTTEWTKIGDIPVISDEPDVQREIAAMSRICVCGETIYLIMMDAEIEAQRVFVAKNGVFVDTGVRMDSEDGSGYIFESGGFVYLSMIKGLYVFREQVNNKRGVNQQ